MSDFTEKDFQKVAKAVSEHISKQRGIRTQDEINWNYTLDHTWSEKLWYVHHVFVRFTLYFFGPLDNGNKWQGRRKKYIETFDSPHVYEKPTISAYADDPMNNPKFLKGIFDSFLDDYMPPSNYDDLWHHLWVLHLYYSVIGCYLDKVQSLVPQRIDLAMIKATSLASTKMEVIKSNILREDIRTGNSTETIQRKWAPIDQKIKCIIDNEKIKCDLKKSTKIRMIQYKWGKYFPNEKNPPKKSKLYTYLKNCID